HQGHARATAPRCRALLQGNRTGQINPSGLPLARRLSSPICRSASGLQLQLGAAFFGLTRTFCMPSLALLSPAEKAPPRTRRPLRRPALLLASLMVVLALLVWLAYAWFHQAALRDAQVQGNAAIQRLANDLMLSVEKFEHLPYLVGAEQKLMQA